MPRRSHAELARALRLAALPGMSLAAASRVTKISVSTLRRARAEHPLDGFPSRDDLIVAVLTKNGQHRSGAVGDPAAIAVWLDYVNHDGSTAAEVTRDLARLAAEGRIVLTGARFRLPSRWP